MSISRIEELIGTFQEKNLVSTATLVEVLATYIYNQGDAEGFADFLEQQECEQEDMFNTLFTVVPFSEESDDNVTAQIEIVAGMYIRYVRATARCNHCDKVLWYGVIPTENDFYTLEVPDCTCGDGG